MPFAQSKGARIYWKAEGSTEKPCLLLLNSIGTDMGLWDKAIPHLVELFRIIRLDTRGHGASEAPSGDYSLATLAEDVTAVMDAAGAPRTAIAGVSLGGMIAMEMALRHPDRVSGLALVCTSASMDRNAWQERVEMVRSGGTAAIADLAMQRFLSSAFVQTHTAEAAGLRSNFIAMAHEGYAGAAAAIRDMNLLERLSELSLRTLVIVGDRDISTPLQGHADQLIAAIKGAELLHLDTAHLAPIEDPVGVAAALRNFFLEKVDLTSAASKLFEAGLLNRRRVLGDTWVDRSLANRTPFNAEFQEMITRIAWQEIWSRPGLDNRTRRLLVLAITISLGRWEEFALHVRAGLSRNGFTRDELKEVLMQTSIYAGVPAGNTAFAEAGKILLELDETTP